MKGDKNPFYGKTHTNDTKNKISEYRTGTTASDETKALMSSQRQGEKNGMYGKGHTEESRKKISETRKAKGYEISGKNNPFYGKTHTKKTLLKIKNTKTIKKLLQEINEIKIIINTII